MSNAGEILRGIGEFAAGASKNTPGAAGQALGWAGLGAQLIGAIVDAGADPHAVVPILIPRIRDILPDVEGIVDTRELRLREKFGPRAPDTDPSGPPSGSAQDPGDEHR